MTPTTAPETSTWHFVENNCKAITRMPGKKGQGRPLRHEVDLSRNPLMRLAQNMHQPYTVFDKRAKLASMAAAMAYHSDPTGVDWRTFDRVQAHPHLQEPTKYLDRPLAFPFDVGASPYAEKMAHAKSMFSFGRLSPMRRNIVLIHAKRPGSMGTVAYIAFPGTDPNDVKDVLGDLDVIRRPLKLKQIQPKYTGRQGNLHIHRGFSERYLKAKPVLQMALDSLRQFHNGKLPSEIVFTGHSLGGALGEIAALDMQKELAEEGVKVTSYMMEAPPIGEKALLDVWDDKHHYNYIYEESPVGGWLLNEASKKAAWTFAGDNHNLVPVEERQLWDASKRVPLKLPKDLKKRLPKAKMDMAAATVSNAANAIASVVPGGPNAVNFGAAMARGIPFVGGMVPQGSVVAASPLQAARTFATDNRMVRAGKKLADAIMEVHNLDNILETLPLTAALAKMTPLLDRDDPAAERLATFIYHTSNASTDKSSGESVKGPMQLGWSPQQGALEAPPQRLALEGRGQGRHLMLEGAQQPLMIEDAPQPRARRRGAAPARLARGGARGAVTRGSGGSADTGRASGSKRKRADKGKERVFETAAENLAEPGPSQVYYVTETPDDDEPGRLGDVWPKKGSSTLRVGACHQSSPKDEAFLLQCHTECDFCLLSNLPIERTETKVSC